jgi:hypothetical protein
VCVCVCVCVSTLRAHKMMSEAVMVLRMLNHTTIVSIIGGKERRETVSCSKPYLLFFISMHYFGS